MRRPIVIAAATVALAAAAMIGATGVESAGKFGLTVDADRYAGPRPLTVAFSASARNAQGAVRYRWCFDDGSQSEEQNPTHMFRRAGYYTVVIQAKDETGEKRTSLLLGAWPRWQWVAAMRKPLTKKAAIRAQHQQQRRTRKRRKQLERRGGLTLKKCTRQAL